MEQVSSSFSSILKWMSSFFFIRFSYFMRPNTTSFMSPVKGRPRSRSKSIVHATYCARKNSLCRPLAPRDAPPRLGSAGLSSGIQRALTWPIGSTCPVETTNREARATLWRASSFLNPLRDAHALLGKRVPSVPQTYPRHLVRLFTSPPASRG